MAVELPNLDGLPKPDAYRQVAVAAGSRIVFVAGQVARTPVGAGDLPTQVEQAYVNAATALDAVGATFEHVAKLTPYVVDGNPEKLARPGAGVARAAERLGIDPVKPVTLLGVQALGEPDLLAEVDAVAVLP